VQFQITVFDLFRLTSWWEMEKFAADVFFALGRQLAIARQNVEVQINLPGNSRDTEMPAASSLSIEITNGIKKQCSSIGLRISEKCIDNILAMLSKPVTLGNLSDAFAHLEKTIKWEMEDRLFMYIPLDRAERFNQVELFGAGVNAKFSSTQYDMVEAGNCYAAGRSTAVVFHLMRVMEIGVQAFGTKLGIALAGEKNWQNILDESNKAIKALPSKDPNTVVLSQAAANLYAVKLAWRNEVMHPKDTYTLEEADNLLRQVKMFMEQLATIV
jgi:hypothetical protein